MVQHLRMCSALLVVIVESRYFPSGAATGVDTFLVLFEVDEEDMVLPAALVLALVANRGVYMVPGANRSLSAPLEDEDEEDEEDDEDDEDEEGDNAVADAALLIAGGGGGELDMAPAGKRVKSKRRYR